MRHRLIPAMTVKVALVLGLGVAGVAVSAGPAVAQVADALGKPLPSPDLPVGTLSVRIVAGTGAAPVTGTDVTVLVNSTPRVARTDSAGRATFAGLPAGARVIAKVVDEDKTEHASVEFPIPDAGGVRVMISTKPWKATAGASAPFAGGGGAGMPNPRQMSGEPRKEPSDAPGMLTVRVAYDDFKDTPEGVPVVLVGYVFDDTTTYQVARTDNAGRVQFTDLDRSGGTSYFAMALVPRNGGFDRLTTSPILLESQVGVRLVLSGEKRSSTAAPVDDLTKADAQVGTPAGKVAVVLEGVGEPGATVTLVDAATKKVLGEAKPQLQAQAAGPDPARGGLQAMFDVAPTEGQVVYAESTFKDQRYRSLPFQLLPAAGTKISIYMFPRVMLRFQLQGQVDDQQVGVQGRFEIMNYSWSPYRATPDGLVIPAPRGFKGGVVFDPDQEAVAVSADEGFRIVRPIPPIGRMFHGGFSLPIESGRVAWSLDLPMGTFESQLALMKTPGMSVSTPPGVKSETRTVPQGTFVVMGPITIKPNQAMELTLDGLPARPVWQVWIPRIVGLLVIGVMLAGILLAIGRKQPAAAPAVASETRRQRLLDELVALERSGGNPKRREQLLAELEELWT